MDEIGDASPQLQLFLRRILDEGAVQGLGDDRPIPVTVRFILATNRDVEADADAGRFRRDLPDRIGFFRPSLPPLRNRRDEILPLMDLYFSQEAGRSGLDERVVLEDGVRDLFRAAPWRGNLRELKHMCHYVATEFVSPDR